MQRESLGIEFIYLVGIMVRDYGEGVAIDRERKKRKRLPLQDTRQRGKEEERRGRGDWE